MKNFILLPILSLSLITFAQSKKTEKAKAILQEGMLEESSMNFEGALKLYKKSAKTAPDYDAAWLQVARTLKKLGLEPQLMKQAYQNILAINDQTKSGLEAYSALANISKNEGRFDSVYYYHQKVLTHQQLRPKQKERTLKQTEQIVFAKKAYEHPLNFAPKVLNENVNAEGALQYFPILTGDESQLLFTRRVKGSQNEDLYLSQNQSDWLQPLKLPGKVNSSESEGTATISADGQVIVCSYCGNRRENEGNCDLYITRLVGDQWGELTNLGTAINTKYYESQPSLSADGRTLYFASDRPNGIGGLDLYVSHQNDQGKWSEPLNLGDNINTSSDEGSPFIHANGQSLFFSSKGHIGLGGYDLYLSEKNKAGSWGESRNLGYPINDQNNQISLFVTAKGDQGYFSKEEFEQNSLAANRSRIWTFVIPPELKLGHRSNYVKGHVYDNVTKQPISAELKLINIETGENRGTVTSQPTNGKYLVMLPEGADYAFYAETKGYLFKSIAFNYKEKQDFEPIELDIYLDPIIKGITVQLNNIYFQTGKSILLNKSKVELNKLYQLLKKNPNLKIELAGHTDNTGSNAINQKLSQNRVNSVKNYLVKKGIASSRLVGKGYGSSKPIATNDTKEGRQKNRRVEFTVL